MLGVVLGIAFWQMVVWLWEKRDKSRKYEAALACRQQSNKPLLVVGGPWGTRSGRRLLRIPAHGNGDVCLDIDRDAFARIDNGVVGNITHIPFADNSFGAVFVSHVMEHLPNTQAAEQALAELGRVAGAVFIAYPSRQSISAWLMRGHHLWVWQEDGTTYFSQRGNGRTIVAKKA